MYTAEAAKAAEAGSSASAVLCPYQHSQVSDGDSAATAYPQGTAWNVVAKSAAGLGVGARRGGKNIEKKGKRYKKAKG